MSAPIASLVGSTDNTTRLFMSRLTRMCVMDVNEAIKYGLLVQAAYAVPPASLTAASGNKIPSQYDPFNLNYTVVASIYGNDLATDLNPTRGDDIVSFGYVLQDQSGNVVI